MADHQREETQPLLPKKPYQRSAPQVTIHTPSTGSPAEATTSPVRTPSRRMSTPRATLNSRLCDEASALGKLADAEYMETHFQYLDVSEVAQAAEMLDQIAFVNTHDESHGVVSKNLTGMRLSREFRKSIMFKGRCVQTSTLLHFAIWFVAEFGVDAELIQCVLDSLTDPDDYFTPATYKTGPKTVFASAVHIAAGLGQLEALQILQKHVCTKTSDLRRLTQEEFVNEWTYTTTAIATSADYMDPIKRSEYEKFYQPIHDSTFAAHADVTLWLLASGAENTGNNKGVTPLHFVAFSGITGCLDRIVGENLKKIVKYLCRSSAVSTPLSATCSTATFMEKGDEKQGTEMCPLEIAVSDASRFPQEHLCLLAPCLADSSQSFFDDIKQIADVSAEGALNLVKSIASIGKKNQHVLRRCRIDAQMDGASDKLASIFYTAPLAASELLELLEVAPEVEMPSRHAIPARAALWGLIRHHDMRCTYQTDFIHKDRLLVPFWEWTTREISTSKSTGSKGVREDTSWHRDFVPRPPQQARTEYIKNVKVVVCLLPNILDVDILMAFAHCQEANLATMGKKTVQGVIVCLWNNLVITQWAVDVAVRFLDVLAYFALAILIPSSEGRSSLAWTIVAGTALHQFITVISTHVAMGAKRGQHPVGSSLSGMWSLTTSWSINYTFFLLLPALLSMVYVVDLSFKDDERTKLDDRLLAICLLMSCFRFIWAWRLSEAGSTIYTIVETFNAAAGNQMLFITGLLMVSFIVALMVLSRLHTMGLAVYTYRGFMFGDGDGFNDIGMDIGHENTFGGVQADGAMLAFAVFGAFFFNVVVLNIIIAIYGHEYEKSQTDTPLKFMKGRADYCVKSVLSSYTIAWRGTAFNICLTVAAVLMIFVAMFVGSSMTFVSFWQMWLSAILLAGGYSLLRMALMQCDWFSPEGQDSDCNQRFLWICHSRDWRLSSRETTVEAELQVTREVLEEDVGAVEKQLYKLDGKIDQIFSALHLQDPLKTPSHTGRTPSHKPITSKSRRSETS